MAGFWKAERNSETGQYTLVHTDDRTGQEIVDRSLLVGGSLELESLERAVSRPLGMLPGERLAVMVSHFLDKAKELGIPEEVRNAGAASYLQHVLDHNIHWRRRTGLPDAITDIEEQRKTG